MNKYNFGLILLRIFDKINEKYQIIIVVLLDFFSNDFDFLDQLCKSKFDLNLIEKILCIVPKKALNCFLIFLENISNNEEIFLFLKNQETIFLQLSVLLMGNSRDNHILKLLLVFLNRFLAPNKDLNDSSESLIKNALKIFNLPIINLLNNDISIEIKILSLKILNILISGNLNNLYEINLLINLMESYEKQEQKEILDEIFNVILVLINKTPQNSFLLMKSHQILKDFFIQFSEKIDGSNIVIFKILYSESKNIQLLNNFSGRPLFLSGVNIKKKVVLFLKNFRLIY